MSKSPSNPLRAGLGATLLLALSVAAVAAQTRFPHAAGTDTTGRSQAVSDAAGRVLIESPEFPRGLWVDLADGAGQALAGIQVEYQGRPDSLVVIWSVDPSGLRKETLLWTRPVGDRLRLALPAQDPGHLPAGLASIDWRTDPHGEELMVLDPVAGPLLAGWGGLRAFLQERWQGRTGRVAVQVDSMALAVDLGHPESVDRLVDYLQDLSRRSLGEVRAPLVQVLLSPYALEEDLPLLRDSIVLVVYVVLVPGSELEEWVLRSLSRSSGPVALSEADSLTRLDVRGRKIVDVALLAALTNLEVLDLRRNQIADVSPLAALTRLQKLWLEENEIVDVSPLAALTDLEVLALARNQITDVSSLAALTGLQWLGLTENQIADVSPLASLTSLKWLTLNESEIVDVSLLGALTGLEGLELGNNGIVDASPLAALTRLEWLELDDNEIADVSSLAGLTRLERLELNNNRIADVRSLAAMTGLERLELHDNELVDVSPLARLTLLRHLTLRDNQIADVGPLAAMTRLEVLTLNYNQIADVSPLAAMTRLEQLTLAGNAIVDVGPLASPHQPVPPDPVRQPDSGHRSPGRHHRPGGVGAGWQRDRRSDPSLHPQQAWFSAPVQQPHTGHQSLGHRYGPG